ncbi:type II toxin-antitoxin system RelE/ParE family toxin [Oceanidesulfovibrio marinus]|uniref:Type II toxin-antitoxin system RelE/ParE family toxin n=1 Tax=Oceanidesulfovibrio marinus TaxID=370038 RepID=A0A6P1ZI82_9BACT|nr:type II toxin-antitoxin system RelE/ParE family toxin [Oceanidesulfovibrio marinus]TVM34897.1 type II toxin-antitoxin system RelE/ParE family toxin [Oceanidesulfovibrio marinus]
MIKSFKGKETPNVWARLRSKLSLEVQRAGLRKLMLINRAATLQDLSVPPGNRLEQLKGDRAGQWSIRINDQWRICFKWEDGDAFDVEIVDYH